MLRDIQKVPLSQQGVLVTNYKTVYGESVSVVKDVETDIVTLTVPTGKNAVIVKVGGEAKTDTLFNLYLEGGLKEKRHNAWTDRNVEFTSVFRALSDEVVKVTAQHSSNLAHDISATISYFEY